MIKQVRTELPSRKGTPMLDAFLKVLAVLAFLFGLLMFLGFSIPVLARFVPLF
jgi:hypothetical protein